MVVLDKQVCSTFYKWMPAIMAFPCALCYCGCCGRRQSMLRDVLRAQVVFTPGLMCEAWCVSVKAEIFPVFPTVHHWFVRSSSQSVALTWGSQHAGKDGQNGIKTVRIENCIIRFGLIPLAFFVFGTHPWFKLFSLCDFIRIKCHQLYQDITKGNKTVCMRGGEGRRKEREW